MRNNLGNTLANNLPLIFLLLGIAFGACVIVFANANTETLITHQTIGATASTVPIDETTNGPYYGDGVFGCAIISAACFTCAAITSTFRRRTDVESIKVV